MQRNDLFFDLGGNSLLFAKVVTELNQKLDIQLNPRELLLLTLGQIAALHDKKSESKQEIAIDPIEPFYFGHEHEKLYGCYHKPNQQLKLKRKCNLIICNPLGFEYQNSHRSLHKLATLLANEGYPVLRFDYFGCGDSLGNFEQGTITKWLENIDCAAQEIRDKTGCQRTCIIGLRFGATLATLYAQKQKSAVSVICWDLIISGKHYLQEMITLQRKKIDRQFTAKKLAATEELLGYRCTQKLCAELARLDLTLTCKDDDTNYHFLDSHARCDKAEIKSYLQSLPTKHSYQEYNEPLVWLPVNGMGLPISTIKSIVQIVNGANS